MERFSLHAHRSLHAFLRASLLRSSRLGHELWPPHQDGRSEESAIESLHIVCRQRHLRRSLPHPSDRRICCALPESPPAPNAGAVAPLRPCPALASRAAVGWPIRSPVSTAHAGGCKGTGMRCVGRRGPGHPWLSVCLSACQRARPESGPRRGGEGGTELLVWPMSRVCTAEQTGASNGDPSSHEYTHLPASP